jgi:thioredoxin 1
MIEVNNQQELNGELSKHEKVLVLFYATWCPFCRGFVPAFDKKTANMGFESIIHVLLNDFDDPMWDEYDVEAVPTVVFFEKSKVSKRLDGRSGVGLKEKQLDAWLQEFGSR